MPEKIGMNAQATTETSTYKKADSILEFRTSDSARQRITARIRTLHESLKSQPDTLDQRKKIVQAACNDLLGVAEGAEFWLRPHVIAEIDRLAEGELERYLYYRYRYDVYPTKRIADGYPPCVQIEPTSICNFRCVFCYQTDQTFSNKKHGYMGMMSLELFKKIVDQLQGEVEALSLASRGEPLACHDFVHMLEYLSGKFLAVKVNTNASLLDEVKSHAILESDIQTLVFSVDTSDAASYGQLRVKGNFEKTLKNIERFIAIKEKSYPGSRLITRVSGVAYSHSQDAEKMERFWGKLVDQVVLVQYNPWENVYESPASGVEKACSDLWRRLFVWWDGRINPCDVDYKSTLSPGSIEQKSISEYWQGALYENMRQKHLKGLRHNIRPCLGCVVV